MWRSGGDARRRGSADQATGGVHEAGSRCAHCGLPAPGGARFCCYGCELAARVQAEGRDDHAALQGTFSFTLVLSMIVMMLALFLYAEDVFDAKGDVEMAWLRGAYRWASLLLATPVMALAGVPLARRALAQLRGGRLSMDALIALGAFAAYALSAHNLFRGSGGIYLDSATAALVLATFGRYLEATARSRASRSLGPLVEVSRAKVYRLGEDGARTPVSASEIAAGMRIEVPAEQVVPADLRIEDAAAEVDLAVLTGESRAVTRARGETVPAGAVPAGAPLRGTALRGSRDSALERLAALARSLSERPSLLLRWADRFAAALTPAVAVLAGAVLVYWARADSLSRGVVSALAVVLAACPCSYAIAAPLVHWLVLRRAFARGVLLRSPDVLEALAGTRVIAFDKTGTLTRPDLAVSAERIAPGAARGEVLGLLRALEEEGTHPIARALSSHARGAAAAPVRARRFVPGRGVEALDARGRALSLGPGQDGAVVLARAGEALATFTLDEALRPEAGEAVRLLGDLGLRVVLLSGDHPARVARVAAPLGVEAHGGLSPEDKIARLAALADRAAMVGDGMNDAPALAGRLTGFTLGDAAPLARGVAQATLLVPDLRLVPFAIALARRGVRLVKWLIGCSTAYNLAFVALAATGALRPVWAGLSMLVSSLIAVSFAVAIGDAEDGAGDAEAAAVPA